MALAPYISRKAYADVPSYAATCEGNRQGPVKERFGIPTYKVEYITLEDQGYDMSQYAPRGSGGAGGYGGCESCEQGGADPSYYGGGYGEGHPGHHGGGGAHGQYGGYGLPPRPGMRQPPNRGGPQPINQTIMFDEYGRKYNPMQQAGRRGGPPPGAGPKQKGEKPYGWWNYPAAYSMSEY